MKEINNTDWIQIPGFPDYFVNSKFEVLSRKSGKDKLLKIYNGQVCIRDREGNQFSALIPRLLFAAKNKVNPMIGAAGISAFPMAARVVQKMALKEDNQNHLLMHAVGANVSGQIASVLAGGIIMSLVPGMIA